MKQYILVYFCLSQISNKNKIKEGNRSIGKTEVLSCTHTVKGLYVKFVWLELTGGILECQGQRPHSIPVLLHIHLAIPT